MVIEPGTASLIQWILSQGIGVAVAVAVIWLVGRKVDQQNSLVTRLEAAIQGLTEAVRAHTRD